jgi:hypothetical protein
LTAGRVIMNEQQAARGNIWNMIDLPAGQHG